MKYFLVAKCYGLNAELLTLLVRMGVHPKVFPDRMHTSVSNLVQHGKFHWEESAKKRKTGQHLIKIWSLHYCEMPKDSQVFVSPNTSRDVLNKVNCRDACHKELGEVSWRATNSWKGFSENLCRFFRESARKTLRLESKIVEYGGTGIFKASRKKGRALRIWLKQRIRSKPILSQLIRSPPVHFTP